MSRRMLSKLAAVGIVVMSLSSLDSMAGVLFSDGFESGDFSHKENGFQWGESNTGGGTSLVAVSTAKAKASAKSMLMRYDGNAAANSWTEKRFSFAGNRQTELWVKFDLFTPLTFLVPNYTSARNNKFFSLYNGDYSNNFQVRFETNYPLTSKYGVTDLADIEFKFMHLGKEQPYDSHIAPLFTTADLGQWMEIIMHFKTTSTIGGSDGVAEMWKNGKKIYSRSNIQMSGVSGYNYMDGAYFLGWANSGFATDLDFFIDGVVFANTPITPGGAETVSPPLAPVLTTVTPG
jgi:hypothetical protein